MTVAPACALSLFVFTGASQFALVGVIAAGGAPISGAMTAAGLGFAVVALLLRAPFLVVVIGAAAVAALIRLV